MKYALGTVLASSFFALACNSPTFSTGSSPSSSPQSQLSSSDTIPTGQTRIKFKAVKPLPSSDSSLTSAVLEIVEISFLKADGSKFSVITGSQSVDILALDTQVVSVLGDTMIPADTYDAIRITVGDNNYVISDGTQMPLKIPSGQQSGIKLQGPYTTRGGRITEVQLEFDADKSMHAAGNKYILKPTAKIVSVASLTIAQENLLRSILGAYSEEQIKQADYIVQSTTSQVTSGAGAMPSGEPMMFTYVTVTNDDVLKGKPGATTQLELVGGSDGDVTVFLPHMPIFHKNENSVLFLKDYPSGLGLIGLSGGKVSTEQ